MAAQKKKPVISFVWRPEEITSAVVEMTRRTKSRAIFDISSMEPDAVAASLLQADASGLVADLKVSPNTLLSDGLVDLLKDTDIATIWMELHPHLTDENPNRYLDRMGELVPHCTVIPIVGSVDLIAHILEEYPETGSIALKGNEASGFVSSEPIFSLYGSVREMIRKRSERPSIMIWGGVATPEAAAAFITTGAGGIAFESAHWLTDLVAVDETVKKRIAGIRPDHTDLIGLNLGVPCRLFNKGNSRAVKELNSFSGSLCGDEIRDEQRRFFAKRIVKEAVAPLGSQFARDELIPLGVEASFAASFARRFGDGTEQAIDAFLTTLEQCCSESVRKVDAFADSATAREMGTRYPFVQGAMSWITDVPEFAVRVSQAGGLPTIALGLMDKQTLDAKLGTLPDLMGGRPYAVNVITLMENPHREEQLAWIRKNRPRFAVIAAGEPSHATELMADGIDVIYIAPNQDLLKLALEVGVRYVICEGNEAGGHVGEHSTLTLSQIVQDLKHRDPALFEGRTIIVAGGICNRETAFMAAVLGADALQMGTAYLATTDIVETDALTELYQKLIIESQPGGTVVTGEGTGLRVRSLKTPRIEAVCSLEREFAAGSEDEASFRRKIETLSAGSLFVAARGLDMPGGAPLDESRCLEEGQFMSGACAGSLGTCVSVEDLHREFATGPLEQGLPVTGDLRDRYEPRPEGVEISEGAPEWMGARDLQRVETEPKNERIAITGMAIVNSLGNSPEDVWAQSVAMRSGIVPVPPSRWDHEQYYHPRPRMPEKTYCRVGAFQNIEISRKDLGIPPQDFRTMTTATRATMWLAKRAIEHSGILDSDIPRERIAVLISQNSGEAAATLEDTIIRGCANRIAASITTVLDLSPDAEKMVAEEVKAGRIVIDDTTLLGRLNCSAGGFICNKYGFMGPSFSVSAACATALVALYSAYQMIRNGIIDAAVVGGAEEYLTPMHFLEFSALGALAGLSGVERSPESYSRPFDADRDGMVLGEGGGMIVIERESVARRRGARAQAYITSMGASNNHLGMVESSRSTQEIAIQASFRDASYGPEGVDLIECHATSTRQGDVEEVAALRTFFPQDKRTTLASFKSQIGHTLGASGVNSLIRGIMAMKAGVLPPNLNYDAPDPEIGLEGSGLIVNGEPSDWELENGRPRRFQVNAFGFGGSNYVVQVEQAMEADDTVLVAPSETTESETPGVSQGEVPEGLYFFETEVGAKPYRVGVLAESRGDASAILEASEAFSNGGPMGAKRIRALARQGIHLGLKDQTPPLAFVFPGQGSHYAGMGRDLYEAFPVVREWMDRAAGVAEFDLLQLLFHDSEEDLQKTRWQQPALFTMEYAMVQYLLSLGIEPTALAGHSLGELTALCLAGVYSFEDGFRIVNKRALCMDKACDLNVDPGVMLACDAPLEMLEEIIAQREHVYVTNINSPRQVVLGGNTDVVTALSAELKEMGYRTTLLRVSMAFHSPIMECIHDELEAFIADIPFHPPRIPVISNTTMERFPEDTAEIKRIVMAHLESPVHWLQNVRSLYDDYGVRLFVEVGPREILSNLIADIIEDADCIQTCLPSAEVTIYKTALAQLYAKGHLRVSDVNVLAPSREKSTTQVPATQARRGVQAPSAGSQPMSSTLNQIVHREIGSFMMESFGRFLRPNILAAIQREYDPGFNEQSLESLLGEMFPGSASPAVPTGPSAIPSFQASGAVNETTPVQTAPEMVEQGPPADVDNQDITEAVIRIIMDATGYERDEIEPEMDLREDLSIRSSRLPVIMDSMEGHFNMKIELEDFMDVRTIRDIADRIAAILGEGGAPATLPPAETLASRQPVEPSPVSREENEAIKRILFSEAPAESDALQPVELSPMDTVVIFSAAGGTGLRKSIGGVFRRDYGATIVPMSFLDDAGEDEAGFDLRTEEGQSGAERKLGELEGLAGLVFVIDDLFENGVGDLREVAPILKGFFTALKTFADSVSKKFVLVVWKTEGEQPCGSVLAQGVLGMLLSASHELSSVQFRSVRLDSSTDLSDAMRGALNRSRKPIETMCNGGQVSTLAGSVVPARFEGPGTCELDSDDVVIFSGGAYGITPYLAKSLVPFGCRMVFLGRTVLEPDVDYRSLVNEREPLQTAVERFVAESRPHMTEPEKEREVARVTRAAEVFGTVEDLRSCGIDASYQSCDVTDARAVGALVADVVDRYGKIDGIVHSAGVLRDRFLKQMTADEFAEVVDVKFLGAWNLVHAAMDSGLRFVTCLSSAASIQGNPGQVNYAAANRAMSALMDAVHQEHETIRCKALILPPVEGAGMAEDPEIRALMARMSASYVHVEELAQLFTHELLLAPDEDVWVMFMRSLPDLPSVRIDTTEPVPAPGEISVETLSFRRADFPMVDTVQDIDLAGGVVEATRSFSHEKDLWINDHRPFSFLKHPLVSAIMALETFAEVAKVLYPQFKVMGIRNAEFLEIISVPLDASRDSLIHCQRVAHEGSEVVCDVTLASSEISPSGRVMDRMRDNYRAQVILGSNDHGRVDEVEGFPLRQEELRTRPMDVEELRTKYEEITTMRGRYRVIETLDGTGDGSIRGSMTYRVSSDFSGPETSNYQYSPYLLEGLMQLANFYVLLTENPDATRTLIPFKIGEVRFTRPCLDQEALILEGRVKSRDQDGILWDSCALDSQGQLVMVARDIRMKWFSK